MTYGLKRYQHSGAVHAVNFSCMGRQPYLATEAARDCFEESLERMRVKYQFPVYAYAVMPEHVHLLVAETQDGSLATAMQALKVSVAKRRPESPFWLRRYYDFNIYSREKFVEKVRYIHRNPVARDLVPLPDMWRWSSYRQYLGEPGVVTVETGRGDAPFQFSPTV